MSCPRRHSEGPADSEPGAGSENVSRSRLNPHWILDWLKKLSDILPGTRMPAYWPDDPTSFYPHFNGDAEAQIRAIAIIS
jgi:hypothetical protein